MTERLYELAVDGLFQRDSILDDFSKLPLELQQQLMPKIIEKLQTVDEYKSVIYKLKKENLTLSNELRIYMEENSYLRREVERLESYFKGNLMPPRLLQSPVLPSNEIPEPPLLNRSRSHESKVFTFDLQNTYC